MSTTTNQYMVKWKTESGEEDYILNNTDNLPLTLEEALRYAANRKQTSAHFKISEIRVRTRQVIFTDWEEWKE